MPESAASGIPGGPAIPRGRWTRSCTHSTTSNVPVTIFRGSAWRGRPRTRSFGYCGPLHGPCGHCSPAPRMCARPSPPAFTRAGGMWRHSLLRPDSEEGCIRGGIGWTSICTAERSCTSTNWTIYCGRPSTPGSSSKYAARRPRDDASLPFSLFLRNESGAGGVLPDGRPKAPEETWDDPGPNGKSRHADSRQPIEGESHA